MVCPSFYCLVSGLKSLEVRVIAGELVCDFALFSPSAFDFRIAEYQIAR
jgi:hypothetical protein